MLVFTVSFFLFPDARRVVSILLFLTAGISFMLLWREHGFLRPADKVTAVRLATAVIPLVGIALGYGSFGLIPALALLLGEATDFIDGYLARRSAPSDFGAFWDAEVDAFFMLSLSLGAVEIVGVPPVVAAAGAFRYAFYFGFLPLPAPTRAPKAFVWFAKSACAVSAVLLSLVFLPFIPQAIVSAFAVTAVAILAASFCWESLLRFREYRRQV
jgi:phosphatidylglycerophosphate synthase